MVESPGIIFLVPDAIANENTIWNTFTAIWNGMNGLACQRSNSGDTHDMLKHDIFNKNIILS